MPKVSVIIPSYNHEAYVSEAVASVLDQTERDLELIVIDDGSVDGTMERLRAFSDPRLRLLSQENQGAHAAINRGLAEAAGEFLAILNSDDAYHPQRLARALAVFEAEADAGLVGSHIEIVDGTDRTLGIKHGYRDCPPWVLSSPEHSFRAGNDLRGALLTENYWATTSNFVFRRSCYRKAGGFRPLRYAHDWDFALRMARVARMVLLPDPLVRYRVHETNTIRENQAAMIFEICWCLAVHLPQHISDSWFAEAPAATRLDQLRHSIYTFGNERVLSLMLLQDLAGHPETALALLEPANPCRSIYLRMIEEEPAGGLR